MSMATWKAEFYKTPVYEVTTADALDHSILKWEGLLPKNRMRHGVSKLMHVLRDEKGEVFRADGDTCALCFIYYYSSADMVDEHVCAACPIALYKLFCTNEAPNPDDREACYDEYHAGPRKMLKLLRAVKEWLK